MPNDNNSFWNAMLTAGASMWAQGKKKKEDNKQLEWMNSILADKRRYEEEKIDRYKSSPAAQMSPMIMEMLVGAYGPKFKKYGIDMPLDRMLAAINGGGSGPGGGSGAPAGSGGSTGGTQRKSIDDISSGREPQAQGRTVSDMIAAQLGRNSAYTAKTGVQTRMGVDSEWENPATAMRGSQMGGASAGSLGSREDTRKSYGSGLWGKGAKGEKAYFGTGATDSFQYTPSTTTSSEWKDPTVHRGGFEGEEYSSGEYGIPGSTLDPIRPEDIMAGLDGADKYTLAERYLDWRDKGGIGSKIFGWLGNAVMPGAPGSLDTTIRTGVNHGVWDGKKGNAGWKPISKRGADNG